MPTRASCGYNDLLGMHVLQNVKTPIEFILCAIAKPSWHYNIVMFIPHKFSCECIYKYTVYGI